MAIEGQEITKDYALYHGDCIDVMGGLKDKNIYLSMYSPPFGGLYHYSSSDRDLSNCNSYKDFFEHYRYVVEEIYRITIPGRISAVHCMDVPKKGANIRGYRDFPGDIIKLHEEIGFEYTPRILIWKEPLAVRNRTMSKALAHRQIVNDSTQTNIAAGDYLIPFRKKGANPIPVVHPVGLTDYAGERPIPKDVMKYKGWTGNQIENRFSHWIWRQYASCLWDDIRPKHVLPFKEAKDEEDEKHIHPLQLDVIERCIVLWSNPGEIVFTPFMGVGSEVYQAVRMGRKGVGAELKKSYFNQSKKNVKTAFDDYEKQGSLFKDEELCESLL